MVSKTSSNLKRKQFHIESSQVYKTYIRDTSTIPVKSITDKKLKSTVRKTEKKFREAAKSAVENQILLTEEAGYLETDGGVEKTWKYSQEELKQHVDLNTSKKIFDWNLTQFGPYSMDYTRNGRHLLIGGRKGHVAAYDWHDQHQWCELYLNETVRDVKWLHNETMFAVAQKKYTYLYDKTGMEISCLNQHIEVNKMEFLPYHYLLATVGNAGWLKYHDTSTGNLVAEHRTKLGSCQTMTQNNQNAVIHLGHSNGTVTLWTPSMGEPVVKMLCHKGPVTGIAIDQAGIYMATCGMDGQLKVWDIRTYKNVHNYFTPTPASSVTISQRGLLGVGYGPHISVWKDAFTTKQKEPYMTHILPGSRVQDLNFCPFEDVLGAGHADGFSSLVIPGSGEPNYDNFEANPFQTKKQRRETEVHTLLEKLAPDMITLDPTFVGKLNRDTRESLASEHKLEWEANNAGEKFVPKKKARGKSASLRRYLRKQGNVIDGKREDMKKKLEAEKRKKEFERKKARGEIEDKKPTALDRFVVKGRL